MTTLSKLTPVFIGFLLITACAVGTIQVPDKYALDNQLERVSSISRYNMVIDWEEVDNQSLIIETGPGTYYLLILKVPSPELVFRNRIRITSSGSMVRAGFDQVIIYGAGGMKVAYPIDRIYKINSTQHMREIRNQLMVDDKDTRPKDNDTERSDKTKLMPENIEI